MNREENRKGFVKTFKVGDIIYCETLPAVKILCIGVTNFFGEEVDTKNTFSFEIDKSWKISDLNFDWKIPSFYARRTDTNYLCQFEKLTLNLYGKIDLDTDRVDIVTKSYINRYFRVELA